MFGRLLREWRPNIEDAQRIIDGRKQWVYLGLELRNGNQRRVLSPDSLDSARNLPSHGEEWSE
jgi:hypothetical protein